MYLAGLPLLKHAKQNLLVNESKETLCSGGTEVWSAMFEEQSWPLTLRQSALALQRLMFCYGTIEMTVARLTEIESELLRQKLIAFCDEAIQLARLPDSAETVPLLDSSQTMHPGHSLAGSQPSSNEPA